MQSKNWGELTLSEKVEMLRRELDEFERIERNNVDARAVQRKEIDMRMAAAEEAQREILVRLARLEASGSPPQL